MYRDFLLPSRPSCRPLVERKSRRACSSIDPPGKHKLKRHEATRPAPSRAKSKAESGRVRAEDRTDVLKCRARKGCSFDLANDRPAPRVSKFSGRGTVRPRRWNMGRRRETSSARRERRTPGDGGRHGATRGM